MTPNLVTIGFSHYCEKARWALQRAGVEFTETMHPPVFHVFHAKRIAGGRTLPILRTRHGTFADSTEILQQLQAMATRWKPYPVDPDARAEVERWEELFDTRLGPHTRRLAYYHLLPVTSLAPMMVKGVGPIQGSLFALTAPVVRVMIRKALRIDDTGAERSRAAIDEVLEQVEAVIEDGRPYLVGDTFTAADLTLASLFAPMLSPPEYWFPMPDLRTLPAPFRREVERAQERPAGRFALRIYREERNIDLPPKSGAAPKAG